MRIGAYVGALSEQALFVWQPFNCASTSLCPWDIHLHDLELEGCVAQRFGLYHQTQFDLIPMLRWKSFPRHNFL